MVSATWTHDQHDFVTNAPPFSNSGGVWEHQIKTVRNPFTTIRYMVHSYRPFTVDNLFNLDSLESLTPILIPERIWGVSGRADPGVVGNRNFHNIARQKWHSSWRNLREWVTFWWTWTNCLEVNGNMVGSYSRWMARMGTIRRVKISIRDEKLTIKVLPSTKVSSVVGSFLRS